ncbi:MAG: hypothetical protein ACOY4I_12965 [Bacillota bacterium]
MDDMDDISSVKATYSTFCSGFLLAGCRNPDFIRLKFTLYSDRLPAACHQAVQSLRRDIPGRLAEALVRFAVKDSVVYKKVVAARDVVLPIVKTFFKILSYSFLPSFA